MHLHILDCEKKKTRIEKALTDAEGVNPNSKDQADSDPDGRFVSDSRVPITDDGCRRSQFS